MAERISRIAYAVAKHVHGVKEGYHRLSRYTCSRVSVEYILLHQCHMANFESIPKCGIRYLLVP